MARSDTKELEERTVDELRRMARERQVPHRSGMRKADLVRALSRTDAGRSGGGGGGRAERSSSGGRGNRTAPKSGRPGGARAAGGRSGGGRGRDGGRGREGGARRGPGSSRSLQYSQEITSPEEHAERKGRSLVTTDHDVIQQWAEERKAQPATVEGTGPGDHLGVLTFTFPRGRSRQRLTTVDWDEWFGTFDERGLNFLFQETRSDGRQSNFFKLENPEREDG